MSTKEPDVKKLSMEDKEMIEPEDYSGEQTFQKSDN